MVSLLGLKSLFGQTSSFLLKQCPSIYNLRLYDETDISVAQDLRIINTSSCKVEAYQGKNYLNEAIRGSDIVVIGDDYFSSPITGFDVMAPKMQDYAKAIAESSPNAVVIVAASPVNKLVPVLSELLMENGYYDCNKIFGSTAVNNLRANCVLASYMQTDAQKVFLPVIGGETEETIVPLFSQAKPHSNISEDVKKRLVGEIKQAPSMIFELKGRPEALNKAYSTYQILVSVMAGLKGEPNIMNIAFTRTSQVDGVEYFALPVLLGRFGIQARYGIPKILPFENDLINESIFNLKKDIDYARLFCKSRDTAAEVCRRNVANKFQKSKEFEKFVNDLKTNKNSENIEEKLINKIKPPIPIEEGQLAMKPGDKPFDTGAFFLKHKTSSPNEIPLVPPHIQLGTSISYNFPKESGLIPKIPQSSVKTTASQPILYPSVPHDKNINYSKIVSLVEKLVKQTTEKIINEKYENKDIASNECKYEKPEAVDHSENHRSEKIFRMKEGFKNSNDVNKVSHNNVHEMNEINNTNTVLTEIDHHPKKKTNITKNSDINIKPCNQVTVSKNGDVSLRKTESYLNRLGAHLNSSKTNRKRKHSETNLESIFKPPINKFKSQDDLTFKENSLECGSYSMQSDKNRYRMNCYFKKENDMNENNEEILPFITNKEYDSELMNKKFNLTLGRSHDYKKRELVAHDTVASKGHDNDSSKSKIVKRILNILNTKPRESILVKDCDESYLNISNFESDLPVKLDITEAGKTSRKNKSHNESIGYKKQTKDSKIPKHFIFNKDKPEGLEYGINEKSRNYASKDGKNSYYQRCKVQDALGNRFNLKNKQSKSSLNEIHKMNKITFFEKYNQLPKIKNKFTKNSDINIKPKNKITFERKEPESPEKIDVEKLFANITKRTKNENSTQKRFIMEPDCKFHDIKNDSVNVNYPLNCVKKEKKETRQIFENKADLPINNEIEKAGQKHSRSSLISRQQTNLNNDENHKPKISNMNEGKLSLECSKSNKKPLCNRPRENNSGTQTDIIGSDLNNLLQILDNDVFKSASAYQNKSLQDGKVNWQNAENNKDGFSTVKSASQEVAETQEKKEEQLSEESHVLQSDSNVQKSVPEIKANAPVTATFEKHQIPDSDKDLHSSEDVKASSDCASQNTKNSEDITKLSDSECNSNQEISSASKEKIHEISNEISCNKTFSEDKGSISIEKQTLHQNPNLGSKVDCLIHSKKPTSEPAELNLETSNRKINHRLFSIIKKSKKDINFSKPKSDTDCTKYNDIGNNSKFDRQQTVVDKDNLFKANPSKSTRERKNSVKPRSSYTVTEKFIKLNGNDNEKNRKMKTRKPGSNHEVCTNYKKTSNKGKQLCTFPDKIKNTASEFFDKNKNSSRDRTPESHKHYKHKYKLYCPIKVFKSSSSKSVISTTKKDDSRPKKNNMSEILRISKQIGDKVSEINKTEHTFRIKDKNGIQNFFLLRGSLPKVENIKFQPKTVNQKDSVPLLRTNVSNEDPLMAIKGKNKLKPISQKNQNDENKETDPLLITHNSVYSPKCPIHGCKFYAHKNQLENMKNKPFTDIDSDILSQNDSSHSNMSNLHRTTNKIKIDRKSSRQKAQYFKTYSTSAMQRRRSPSRTSHNYQQNTHPYHLPNNNPKFKPSGYYHTQRISKILESGVKQMNKSDSNIKFTKLTKECKASGQTKNLKTKELSKSQPRFLTEPIVPFHTGKTGNTVKIVERFFNRGFNSSYVERTLKTPPESRGPRPCKSHINSNMKRTKPSISKMDAQSLNINWMTLKKKSQLTNKSSDSNENDILVRGTCLEHVKNKFLSNKIASNRNFDLSDKHQNNSKSSMDTDSISSAYNQYTKDVVKNEYCKCNKFPSLRQLHQKAFRRS